MNVTLNVYTAGGSHKLTVIARPSTAAALGEFVLIEGAVMDLPQDPTAPEALREAYRMVAVVLRGDGAGV